MPLYGNNPTIYDSASLADSCTIIGEVVLGDHASVGYEL
jgi:carbonic anhydrase/acetyltransferase-like protein (isoleucine patch superfamily)